MLVAYCELGRYKTCVEGDAALAETEPGEHTLLLLRVP